MGHSSLLLIIVLLAAAVIAGALLRRARLPAILAYLFTGVLVGPHVLGWIPDTANTQVLAEFGVVFLLFTLGLEFSLPRLIAMRREVLVLGGGQIAVTTVIIGGAAYLLNVRPGLALVLGGAFAMSSTAVVVKQLADQKELGLTHGRQAVAVLLFQDLAAIPFLILIPELAHTTPGSLWAVLAWSAGKGLLALVLIFIAGRWLIRPFFYRIAAARSAELFTLTVLLFTLVAAWITQNLGLSLALGAFLVGMALGETEFRHQVEAEIRPFRDVLLGLFFVTIGMLVDPQTIHQEGAWILLAVVALLVLKTLITMGMSMLLGTQRMAALRTGLVLSEGGEFGFALLALSVSTGVLGAALTQFALAVIVLTMMIGPVIVLFNRRLAGLAFREPLVEEDVGMQEAAMESHQTAAAGHVIITGYGRVGQNVARFLEQENFEYVALDLDPARVRAARAAGDDVFFGDAAEAEVLKAAAIDRARALVIAYSDISAALRILTQAKRLRPDLPVLVRTRDDSHLEELQRAGATEVIPETLEASLMVASHLLTLLHVPASRIFRKVQRVRADRYSLLRNVFRGQGALPMGTAHAFREQLDTVTLGEDTHAVGQRLADLKLDTLGVMVTALRRSGIVGRQPDPATVLKPDDILVLYGTPEDIDTGKTRLLTGR